MKFSQRYLANDDIVKIVWQLFDIVPPILQKLGKVSNPWPNVDAHSGAILVHYGIKEYNFIQFYLVYQDRWVSWPPIVGLVL
jgi:citrate synthase